MRRLCGGRVTVIIAIIHSFKLSGNSFLSFPAEKAAEAQKFYVNFKFCAV